MRITPSIRLVTSGIFVITFDRSGRKETWISVSEKRDVVTLVDNPDQNIAIRAHQLQRFLDVSEPGNWHQLDDGEVTNDSDAINFAKFSRVHGALVFKREIAVEDLRQALDEATKSAGGKLDTDD